MSQLVLDHMLGLTSADTNVTPEPEPASLDTLDHYAFLYTTTMKGTNSGIRFAATIEDAQKWCSSPLSKGVLHGNEWIYMYTSISNWIGYHWGVQYYNCAHALSIRARENRVIDLSTWSDNGTWDERIASTGCKKISLPELSNILAKFNIKVKGPKNG